MTPASPQIKTAPFINRTDELEMITAEKLQPLAQGASLFQFIIMVSGIPGIGKTTLLEETARIAGSLGIEHILLSLGKNRSEKQAPFYIFKQLAEKCFEKEAMATIQGELGSLPQMDEDRQRLFLNQYSQGLASFLKDHPTVLMIDDSHRLNELERTLLEGVLERVARLNKLLVILAGRSDLRWQSFELRRRAYRISLRHFDQEETGKLILGPKDERLSSKIYQLTRGYPLASVQALEWVNHNLSVAAPEFHQQLTDKETDLVLSLTDTILTQFILSDIPDSENRRFLEKLLKTTSPLRRFDNDILADLLNRLNPLDPQEHEIDTFETLRYIRELSAYTHLVTWNSQKMGYSTDPAVRRLIALSMKYKEEDTYLDIHDQMRTFYQDEMKTTMNKDPSSPQSVLYLMEYIFHDASHQIAEKPASNSIQGYEDLILETFRQYRYREKNHFYEEFKNDEELHELLGTNHETIIELVEKHI